MTSRRETAALAVLLAAAASAIYLWRLGSAPVYLLREEAFLGAFGHAIASKGRDLQGQFLPFYVYSPVHAAWWAPILPYTIAAVVKVFHVSEAAVRAPMAIAAVVNVLLVFFIGQRLFAGRYAPVAAAALAAVVPAQVIENRYANDPALPATFALAWLLMVVTYLESGAVRLLFAAGLVLGVGMYSYVAAAALMPLYAMLTILVLRLRGEPVTRDAALVAGLAIPLAIGIPWFIAHPEAFRGTFMHYQDAQVQNRATSSAVAALADVHRIGSAASLYARFWNPRFLFIDGAPSLMHSTARSGVFLVSMAGLLLVGLARTAARSLVDHRALLVAGAFVLAPLPTTLVDPNDHAARYAIWRAMEVVPLGALLAGCAIDYGIHARRSRVWYVAVLTVFAVPLILAAVYGVPAEHAQATVGVWSAAAAIVASGIIVPAAIRHPAFPGQPGVIHMALAALLAAGAVEFRDFYSDYMTAYQDRYVSVTDGNVGEALEAVIAREPVHQPSPLRQAPVIYLGFRFGPAEWGSYYWAFFLHKHRREDLLARTIDDVDASQFSYDRICQLPPRSVVFTQRGWNAVDSVIERMIQNKDLDLETLARDRHGESVYWILRTTGSCAAH